MLSSLILRYPVPAGSAFYSAAESITLRIKDIIKDLVLFGSDDTNSMYVKSEFTVQKELDLLKRFSKEHPNFGARLEFAKEFENKIID
jgi:hypothetical protein